MAEIWLKFIGLGFGFAASEDKVGSEKDRAAEKVTAGDLLIHRSVAHTVSGLREFLEVERKRIPGEVLYQADRLQCLLFDGYDPYFQGGEPPGF